jgi:hypothetical protein
MEGLPVHFAPLWNLDEAGRNRILYTVTLNTDDVHDLNNQLAVAIPERKGASYSGSSTDIRSVKSSLLSPNRHSLGNSTPLSDDDLTLTFPVSCKVLLNFGAICPETALFDDPIIMVRSDWDNLISTMEKDATGATGSMILTGQPGIGSFYVRGNRFVTLTHADYQICLFLNQEKPYFFITSSSCVCFERRRRISQRGPYSAYSTMASLRELRAMRCPSLTDQTFGH